jgi:hypothetical protein
MGWARDTYEGQDTESGREGHTKKQLGSPSSRWNYTIKIGLKDM